MCLTWWAADIRAGSNAEKAAAADDAENCPPADVDEEEELTTTLPLDEFRKEDKLTYGATLQASSGVDIGGLWLESIIPGNIFENFI